MLTNRLWNIGGCLNHLTNSFRSISLSPIQQLRSAPRNDVSAAVSAAAVPTGAPVTLIDRKSNDLVRKEVFDKVNRQIDQQSEGRLFAVVHLCGKQFKVTAGDIILVEGYWPPTIGDKIRLDKVLVAGGQDFSFIGRPIIQKGLVDVQATIIEKTLTHTKTNFKKKRRKQYTRFNFYRSQNTMIMINSIDVTGRVNEMATAQIEDNRIF